MDDISVCVCACAGSKHEAVWPNRNEHMHTRACVCVCMCPRVYYKRAGTTSWLHTAGARSQKASCGKRHRTQILYGERTKRTNECELTNERIQWNAIRKRRIMRPITLALWFEHTNDFNELARRFACSLASKFRSLYVWIGFCSTWLTGDCTHTCARYMYPNENMFECVCVERMKRMFFYGDLWLDEPTFVATTTNGFCSKIIFGAKNQ